MDKKNFLSFLTKLTNISKYKNYLKKILNTVLYHLFIKSGLAKYKVLIWEFSPKRTNHEIDYKKVQHYLTFMSLIEGWLEKEAAQLFLLIDYLQKKENIQGNLFEIGAHYGRSSILLALMTNYKTENLGICDIFENQDFNYSSSGKGNKKILIDNLNSYLNDLSFIKIHNKQSENLQVEDCKNCRFFFIDGGHTSSETYSDLVLASKSILEKGVIAIDDIFSEIFPGVMDGFYKFMNNNNSLAPFLIGFNKLFLCRIGQQKWYLEKINHINWKDFIQNPIVESLEKELTGYKVKILSAIPK